MSATSNRRLAVAAALLASTGLALWWLSSQRAPATDAPRRHAAPRSQPGAEPSSVTLPVVVPFSELAATIEAQVPEVVMDLQGDELSEGWAADLRVRRPGSVRVRGDERQLIVEVPLALDARVYRSKRAERRAERGKDPGQGIAVSFEAVLDIDLGLELDPQWHLISRTELEIRWIDPPTLELGPLKLPIRKPVEKALLEPLQGIAADIDARLAEADPVRTQVERAWAQLSAPRKIQDQPPLWVVGRPEALYASDLQFEPDQLSLIVGYRGSIQTVLGEPGPTPALRPLPDRTAPPDAPGFSVLLPAVLPWDALSAAAEAALGSQTWAVPGSDLGVQISGVELYPSGDLIAVKLDYRARHPGYDTAGTVYLTGRPVVREDRTVAIEAFEYHLDTEDRAVWSASWLGESGLEAAIGERLVFDYGARIDAALAELNGNLDAGHPTEDRGTVTGAVDAIQLTGIAITDDALVIDVRASGDLSMRSAPRPMERAPPPTLDLGGRRKH